MKKIKWDNPIQRFQSNKDADRNRRDELIEFEIDNAWTTQEKKLPLIKKLLRQINKGTYTKLQAEKLFNEYYKNLARKYEKRFAHKLAPIDERTGKTGWPASSKRI
jgi:hypothetical protein